MTSMTKAAMDGSRCHSSGYCLRQKGLKAVSSAYFVLSQTSPRLSVVVFAGCDADMRYGYKEERRLRTPLRHSRHQGRCGA